MIPLQGIVVGRKAGTPKENGQVFDTLVVESAGREYYVGYERKLLPYVTKGQEIALACNVTARNNFLNLFANDHLGDQLIVNLDQFTGNRSNAKFDDF